MLIPTHCQTCGEPIGHLESIYKGYVIKIAKEMKLPIDNADFIRQKQSGPTPEYLARKKLIEEHGLDGRRECCLYALFVNHDITDIVN